jgi:hypothetical protein
LDIQQLRPVNAVQSPDLPDPIFAAVGVMPYEAAILMAYAITGYADDETRKVAAALSQRFVEVGEDQVGQY